MAILVKNSKKIVLQIYITPLPYYCLCSSGPVSAQWVNAVVDTWLWKPLKYVDIFWNGS